MPHNDRSIRSSVTSAARFFVVVAIAAIAAPATRPGAQEAPAPDFAPVGLQPGRAYFSQLPFESIDMINGNVILTFTDLALPGNAGMDLRLTRTYNHQEPGRKWEFGFAGVPLRIANPDGNGSECCDWPRLVMADGSSRVAHPRDAVFNDTVFVTDEFWRYTATTRTLEMPNGWTATYESGAPSGGVMLVEVHDVFGNTITPDWEGGAPEDLRPLRLESVTQTVGSVSRIVSFEYDGVFSPCGWMPKKMTFVGREWTYACEFADVGLQSGSRLTKVTPPVGPAWTYSYVNGLSGSITVTTPGGGTVLYDFDEIQLPPTEGTARSVIKERVTGGRAIPGGKWTFAFSQPAGAIVPLTEIFASF
jgi:hypothetical protein